MKKVLILSYFFPPCNLTASQRAFGWAKYLKKFGYYPVIITRNWDNPISTPIDVLKKSGTEIKHVIKDDYEVYYLPYKGSLRDRFFVKYGDNRFDFFRRFLTFFEIFFENFSNKFIPYRNIYDFAVDYIEKNKNIERIVITANPFTMFRFGYMLHNKFKIKWLADYRDDWNTSDFLKNRTFFEKTLNKIRSNSEKKWVGTAERITTVSEAYSTKISNFVHKQGHVLLNGYFSEDFESTEKTLDDKFTIIYNGSLYPTQEIEIFLSAYIKLINKIGRNNIKIKIVFPGLLFDKVEALRVSQYLQGYEDFFEITTRIPQKQVFQLQAKSHLFLMVAHKGLKGIPSSKLYEYIGFGKPILACPSDNDIVEDTLKDYNIGYICDTSDEVLIKLGELYSLFESGKYDSLVADESYQKRFTREHSSKELSIILDGFNLTNPESGNKSVLILAHDFPPYTSIGALRPASWHEFLNQFGIYPIVVTRQWDQTKQTAVDVVKPSIKQYITTIKSDNGTIVRVPYKPNLRDHLIIRYGLEKLNILRRSLTLYYSIMKFISRKYDNTDKIYEAAREIILNNKIDYIIATGEPFILFKYAYKLSKEFNIKWIADYRDGWTTNLINVPKNRIEKAINSIYTHFEKKYLRDVSLITKAASTHVDVFKNKYPDKETHLVLNGYNELHKEIYDNTLQNDKIFTITYSGTIYGFQRIDIFLEGFKKFIAKTNAKNCRILFIGLDFYAEQHDYLFRLYPEVNDYLTTTGRIPNKDVLIKLRESNILLLLSEEDSKTLPAKIFEYFYADRKIYLVKNDRGILEKFITESTAGVALDTSDSVCEQLLNDYKEFNEKGFVYNKTSNIEKYSRRYQASVLANLILSLKN